MPVEEYQLKTTTVTAIQYKMGKKCMNREAVIRFLGPMFDPALSLETLIHFKNERGRYYVVTFENYVYKHPVLGVRALSKDTFENLYQLKKCPLQIVHNNN